MNVDNFDDASALDLMEDNELEGSYFDDSDESENQNQPDNPQENNVGDNNGENFPPSRQGNSKPEDSEGSDEDFTTEVLRLKGISDPNKIKFEDESGAIVEKSWDSLSRTEQLNILTQEGNPETDLIDSEIELINTIRTSGLSPEQYLQQLQQRAIQEMQDSIPNTYEIDALEDDELFALDLIEKVGEENITDEELQQAIADAKQNPDLYQRQINALRTQYKTLEDKQRAEQDEQEAKAAEQEYNNFSNTILQEIQGFNQLGNQEIELSVDDMNDLANFILTRDENGVSDFGRVMNDPRTFTMAAFWTLKGPEIMAEMQEQIQEAYKRGFTDGGKNIKSGNRVTVQKSTNTPSKQNYSGTFDGDDESYLYQ